MDRQWHDSVRHWGKRPVPGEERVVACHSSFVASQSVRRDSVGHWIGPPGFNRRGNLTHLDETDIRKHSDQWHTPIECGRRDPISEQQVRKRRAFADECTRCVSPPDVQRRTVSASKGKAKFARR